MRCAASCLLHCAPARFTFPRSLAAARSRRSVSQSTAVTTVKTTNLSFSSTANMATPSDAVSGLARTLGSLGLELPKYANSFPDLNPVDIYRAHLAEILAPITGVDRQAVYNAIQWTATLDKGDATLPVPALRIKGKKPDEVAKEIGEQWPESPLIEKPTVLGQFIPFFFKQQALTDIVIPQILEQKASYGFNPIHGAKDQNDPAAGKKKMIVEFSSPNIAKPFHAGHLRSTIIGGFLANLYEAAGWDVVRMNYLGDWGKQYGVLAVGFEAFGDEAALEANPIGHLYDVYVKVNVISSDEQKVIKEKQDEAKLKQEKGEDASALLAEIATLQDGSTDEKARQYFRKISDGDKDAVALWRKFRDLSIVKYKETYARLNIHYDDYSGESQVQTETMDRTAQLLADKKVSQEDGGAVIIDLTKYSKKLGKAMVKKKDGTSLYLTRDISAMLEREQRYKFDRMIYVVASQQDLHLAQLFKIVEAMGRKDLAERSVHVNFGMVLGMSTRKGTAKFLDDILRDVGDKMHDVMRANEAKYAQVENPHKVADTLGISAVMVQDMSGKRINNYHFDMDRMTSFEGDTGPYLQYAHARLCSMLRRAQVPEADLANADLTLLTEKHAGDLVRMLAQWPDAVGNTLRTLEPVTVLTYLFRMAHVISSSYEHLQAVGSAPELKLARVALYTAARQVLSNGMRLLGLTPVERYVLEWALADTRM